MKKLIKLCLTGLLCLILGRASAQTLANYSFTGHDCATPVLGVDAGSDANLTFSNFSNNGCSCTATANVFNYQNWPTGGLSTTKYNAFTVTANSGCTFTVSGITFKARVSSGTASWAIRSSADGYAANLASGTGGVTTTLATITATFSSSVTSASGGAITFRIYYHGLAATTTTCRTDDVAPQGTSSCGACSPTNVTSSSATAGNGQATINWTNPACFDQIMVVAKTSTNTTAPSGTCASYTGNAAYGSGSGLGGGFVVYNNTSNNVVVTSLTNGTTYFFKIYTCKGGVWSTGVEVSTTPVCPGTNPTGVTGTAGNGQATINWTNPASACFDQMMVVAKTSTNSTAPSGACNSYTGNTTYGSGSGLGGGFVVYNNTSNSVTVTGLTNGTIYYFKVYTCKSGTWTSGVEVLVKPTDGIERGLVVNELTNGPSGNQEYVELVVSGVPGTTMDIRGWIVDDNNGDFNGGSSSQVGIADGYLQFSNHCNWEQVPTGSIILLYNAGDKNDRITGLGLADDPYDANLDYVYVIPIGEDPAVCGTVISDVLFNYHCTSPNATSTTYPATTASRVNWLVLGLRNGGDAMQTRYPDLSYFHGFSFGTIGAGGSCGTCDIDAARHPDNLLYGANSCYTSLRDNRVWSFVNTNSSDFRNVTNWSVSALLGANDAAQTPGSPNNAANSAWIASLKNTWPVNAATSSDVCNIRPNEIQEFFAGTAPNSQIIARITNNGATNHGSTTVTATLNGGGNINTTLSGTDYYFLQKYIHVTPTTSTGANYTIRLYYTDAELTSYKNYINTTLGTSHTNATIRPLLSIYKAPGAEDVTAPTALVKGTTATGTHGAFGYWFEATFTSFSGFGVGSDEAPLPVEDMKLYAALDGENGLVTWSTSSEINSAVFEIEKSTDGSVFYTIDRVPAHGTTKQTNHYAAYDYNLLHKKQYYRLRQVDYDGTSSYSNVAELDGSKAQGELRVYPNPTDGTVHIAYTGSDITESSIELYSIDGVQLLAEAGQLSLLNTKLNYTLSSLTRSVYTLKICYKTGTSTTTSITKIVKI